jgi:hypothetical protein
MGWPKRRTAAYLEIPESNLRRYLAKLPPMPAHPEDVEIVTPIHLTPSSPPTPIRDGDAAYCVVSDLTGIEGHPKLRKPRPRKPEKAKAKFKPKIPRRKKA